jgi:hypothetical protein
LLLVVGTIIVIIAALIDVFLLFLILVPLALLLGVLVLVRLEGALVDSAT